MLEVKNLSKIYQAKGASVVKALDKISLRFPETGMVFLLGKSGSGKSTLLNICGGLDSPTEGEIIVKGRSSKTFSQSDFDSYRNTYIGFIFQEYNVLDEFSVEDNLALALELQGKKKERALIAELLEDVDLAGYETRKPNTLSGGQKQRIAIARALIKSPQIIMADEPTGALDSETGRQIFDTLKNLSKEKLVLVVSHDREFAEKYGDRIIELKDGRVISDISKMEGKAFSQTEEGKIEQKTYREEEKQFVRSKLPIRHAVKMGISGLKTKPVRLAFTVLLSILTFMIFGLFSTLTFYNPASTVHQTFLGSSLSAIKLEKKAQVSIKYYSYGALQSEYVNINSPAFFSEAELNEYAQTFQNGVFGGVEVSPSSFSFETKKRSDYWLDYFSALAYLPEEHTLRNKLILGNYPAKDSELCISSYLAQSMLHRQIKLSNNEALEATSIDALLGTQCILNGKLYQIVGIIESEEIPSVYEPLKNDMGDEAFELRQELKDYLEDGLHLVGFVTKDEVARLTKETKDSIEFGKSEQHTLCYPTQANNNGKYDFGDTYYPNGKYNAYSKLSDKTDLIFFEEEKTALADKEAVIPANIFLSRLKYIEDLYMQALNAYSNAFNDGSYDRNLFISNLSAEYLDKDYVEVIEIVLGWEEKVCEDPQFTGLQEGEVGYAVYQAWKIAFEPVRLLWEEKEYYAKLSQTIDNLERNGEIIYNDGVPTFKDYTREERAVLIEEVLPFLKEVSFDNILKIKLCDELSQMAYGDVEEYTIVGVYGLYDFGSAVSNVFYLNDDENARLWDIQKINVVYNEETTSKYETKADEIYNLLLISYSHSEQETSALVELWKNRMEFNEEDVRFMINSSFVSDFELVNNMIGRFSTVFLYVGIAFAVFTMLLLSNFISVSISQKRKDIGILRALGARGADVFKIFFSEAFFITSVCILLSIIGSLIVCQIANAYMMSIIGVAIFVFGILSVLVLIGLALITIVMATFIPVYLEAKKKPVESIRVL